MSKTKVSYKEKIERLLEHFTTVQLAFYFMTSVATIHNWKAGNTEPLQSHRPAIDKKYNALTKEKK